MKRLLSLFVGLALLLCACSPAAPQPDPSAPGADVTLDQLAQAILDASGRSADELERTDQALDESALSAYLTNFYGLEEDSWTGCVIYRAGGADAFELAVLQFTGDADVDAAASGLAAYILDREGDFTGYAPDQAAIVNQSVVAQQGRFAALLICEDAEAVRAAFNACFEDTVHPDAPAPSTPASGEPAAPSAEPSQPIDLPFFTQTPASPDPPVEPSPSPAQSDAPETPSAEVIIQPSPSPGANRYPFTPPNRDDMTLYDTSAIRSVWENGDPSGLSDYDRAIYDRCQEILDEIITDGMSDYEKELAVYRKLTRMASYDQDHYDNLAMMDPGSYNPYGPLINGKGICIGFATSFQLLMDLCGVECITVIGAAFQSSEDHAWNMVRLNGEWYCVDSTWDLKSITYIYFNVTSEFMAATNHQWDYDNVPEATATDYGNPS